MWVQITSGLGPVECQWVVAQLLRVVAAEAAQAGLAAALLGAADGDAPGTLRSALLSIDGTGAEPFVAALEGTVRWVGRSHLRPTERRRNFFVGVEALREPERATFSARDLRIETLRASGPGGQHVNKTESCVRVVHVPTGLSAVAREERSQQQNRRLALARLRQMIEDRQAGAEAAGRRQLWEEHRALVRGNPVRTYEGQGFLRRAT